MWTAGRTSIRKICWPNSWEITTPCCAPVCTCGPTLRPSSPRAAAAASTSHHVHARASQCPITTDDDASSTTCCRCATAAAAAATSADATAAAVDVVADWSRRSWSIPKLKSNQPRGALHSPPLNRADHTYMQRPHSKAHTQICQWLKLTLRSCWRRSQLNGLIPANSIWTLPWTREVLSGNTSNTKRGYSHSTVQLYSQLINQLETVGSSTGYYWTWTCNVAVWQRKVLWLICCDLVIYQAPLRHNGQHTSCRRAAAALCRTSRLRPWTRLLEPSSSSWNLALSCHQLQVQPVLVDGQLSL